MKKFLQIQTKTFEELQVTNYKELWEKALADGYTGLSICVETSFVKSADSDNSFHAIFSTASEDRHGDIVYQNWDLKSFKKNPVYLDSHNYDSIEHIIGRIENVSKDVNLEGDIVFALSNPKGVLAYNLAKDGFLKTNSVGFIPKEFDDKGNILKSELLEVSAVSVPANAEALYGKKEKEEEIEKKEIKEEVIVNKTVDNYKPIVNQKELASKVLSDMVEKQNSNLKLLAKSVQELTDENRLSKKREIHQIIRNMISKI